MKPTPIAIDRIQTESGTQMREQPNEHVVSDYAAMLDGCKDWPFDSALKVFHDGTEYYLADGFHRYLAAVRVNRSSVMCDVEKGTLRDAIRYALSANSRHGLRRTNADKRKAVTFAINDAEWCKLSSRAIADLCGVGHTIVDELRRAQVASDATSETSNAAKHDVSETRVGKNGVAQPVLKKMAKVEETAIEDCENLEPEPVHAERSAPQIDAAADRARRMIPDLCKSLRLQLGNLGAGRRFEKSISEIEEFAR